MSSEIDKAKKFIDKISQEEDVYLAIIAKDGEILAQALKMDASDETAQKFLLLAQTILQSVDEKMERYPEIQGKANFLLIRLQNDFLMLFSRYENYQLVLLVKGGKKEDYYPDLLQLSERVKEIVSAT